MTVAVAVAILKALVALSLILFILGMIKPKWILFWMNEPSRILVSGIALSLFMVSMTGFTQLTVHPKQKSERDRTNEETNNLNLGPTERR
jgi:ABC-type nickel/cobalt efflux system permease component RcnA